MFSTQVWGLLIFVFSIGLYVNTLSHGFVQDDAIVIYDNMYTTQGVKGIPGILGKDTFFGFFKQEGKDKLVSGGRYRPLTLVLFTLEWQLAGKNPFFFHLSNILWYGILCWMLFKTILLLLKEKYKASIFIAIMTSFIFAAHPIHTEVVANIKGRDEIISMIGSLLSLYGALKYVDTKNKKWLILIATAMFLGCMSKENAITYLAVIPIAVLFFRKTSFSNMATATLSAVTGAIAFLIIRTSILGVDFGGAPNELMNNPFLKLVSNINGSIQYIPFDFSEKMATILFTLGKYIQLLFFPHPLTHDYYPRHIDIMQFSDPAVILAGIMYVMLIAMALVGLRKKDILTFCILYFLITLSIVSNIIFPIGTNMSERFMFMPSLGFALILAYGLHKWVNKKSKYAAIGILSLILSLYSAKTISRNMVWKNDFTLFNTDISTSKRSAKLQNAVGGSLSTEALNEKDEQVKKDMLLRSVQASKEALAIHPSYLNAYLIQGNSYFHLGEYDNAERAYGEILEINPSHGDAIKNLAISLRERGRELGSSGQVPQALQKLKQANSLLPNDIEIIKLLGIGNGISGNHQEAIRNFEKALQLEPNSKELHRNLSKAYSDIGNQEKTRYHSQLAQ